MTLDKAIEIYEKGAKLTWNGKPTVEAEECQQMVEWLKELQAHREAWGKITAEIQDRSFENPMMNPIFTMSEIYEIIDKYKPKEGDTE